jgi:hypothetical protein
MIHRVHRVLLLAVMTLAVFTTVISVYGFLLFPHKTDLLARYREGQAWVQGTPLYLPIPSVNMFPPWVTQLIFAPMSRLPFRAVQVGCLALNALALAISLRSIAGTLGLSATRTVAMSAVLLSLHGMLQSWMLGQFTGLLLLPTTLSWIAFRKGRHVLSGAWLAPVIALKPTFAMLALLLPVPVWLSAGLLSLTLTLIGVAMTGTEAWRHWIAAGASVDWIRLPFNASLWGLVARWQAGEPPARALQDLNPFVITGVLIAIVFLARHARTSRQPDRRYFFATVVSVLASPLGWIYYVPLAVGPATATWPGSLLAMAACAVLISPMIGPLHEAGPVLGSMYFVGLMGAWVAWAVAEKVPEASIKARRSLDPTQAGETSA